MKTLLTFINETYANKIRAESKLRNNASIDDPYYKEMARRSERYESSSPDHIIYHSENNGNHMHVWVHKGTGAIDFVMVSKAHDGAMPNERIHHDINIASREGGPRGMGATAFHDLWDGRVGKKYGITIHRNQSPGAIKMHRRIRKIFGDKIIYHTFNPRTGEAQHHMRGVAASDETPESLRAELLRTDIVAFKPKKHRLKEPQKPLE